MQDSESQVECPECKGTGWILYETDTTLYACGKATFAKRCDRCAGVIRSNDQTGVPEKMHDCDLSKFDFDAYASKTENLRKVAYSIFDDWKKWRSAGKGLYLVSKTPGSGKTFLACCIAKSIMLKYNLQMRFITSPDYIACVGDSYKRQPGEQDRSEIYRTCELLVLDDLGAQADKDWQRQEIFRLINGRMEQGLVTIITSNLTVEALNVDERTKDRIYKGQFIVNMPEESIRRKKAKEEQNRFIGSIFGG